MLFRESIFTWVEKVVNLKICSPSHEAMDSQKKISELQEIVYIHLPMTKQMVQAENHPVVGPRGIVLKLHNISQVPFLKVATVN